MIFDAILIIGYGSRKDDGMEIVKRQAARIRNSSSMPVYTAFFRVNYPTLPDVMKCMMSDGIENVLAVPYLVADGVLTKEFIPKKMRLDSDGIATIGGKKITVKFTSTVGNNPVITSILKDRISACGGSRDSGIILLGHGSKRPENSTTVALNAKRLSDAGYKHVKYAFNEFNEPTVAQALSELANEGVSDIVAVPLFIAVGIHLGEEIP